MIRIELAKQLRRPRTYVTFVALVAFGVVLTVALAATGAAKPERVGDVPLLITPARSGFSVPVVALASTMKFFIPLAVAVFGGEAVAGEAGWGSLRYVLARGVPRTRLLVAKAVVAGSFSLAAVVVIPLAGLLAGVIAWGWHPLVAVDGSVAPARAAVFAPLSALGWLGLSTLYVAAGMVSIFAFAFFLSTLTTRPLVAVSGGVGLTIVSRVLNADYLPGVAVLNGYMPNNDVDLWQHFLQRPVDGAGMAHFLVLQVVYGVVFGGLAWWWFRRKDVLS